MTGAVPWFVAQAGKVEAWIRHLRNGSSQSGETGSARVGVGLANVKRRLRLCYGPETDLLVESSSAGTKVEFAIPLLAETWLRLGR